MSKTVRWSTLLLFLILSLTTGSPASAGCIENPNSDMSQIDGQTVCAYTGDGCSACSSTGRRGEGSWDICYYDWDSGDLVCTYYM
jgi:hypothetical protein